MATKRKGPRPIEEVAADYERAPVLNSRGAEPLAVYERLKDDPIIATLAAHATAFRAWAATAATLITDDATLAGATSAIETAKVQRDGVEKHRKAIVAEPKRHLRNIDQKFAEVRKPYDEAIELLQNACGEFVAARQRAAAAAFAAGGAALDAGDALAAAANLAAYNALQVTPAKGALRTEYDARATDLAIVPLEWLTLDVTKCVAAKAADPSLEIPGVEFTESTRLTVTKPRTTKATEHDQED